MPKPQTVLCYICGRDFGPHSINVHERQCAKRWEANKKKEKEIENEKDARKRKTSRDKSTIDPWRVGALPPIRGKENFTRSMHDIRTPSRNEPHATSSEKEFMHVVRPQTVTLKEKRKTTDTSDDTDKTTVLNCDKTNGNEIKQSDLDPGDDDAADISISIDDSEADQPETVSQYKAEDHLLNGEKENLADAEKPVQSSPKVASARPGTGTLRKHLPSTVLPNRASAMDFMNKKSGAKSASPVNNALDVRPGTVTLRKHSAPETTTPMPTSHNSSPVSSVSSSDSQDPTAGLDNTDFPNIGTPRFRSSKNPNMLVCYICGNEYGSKSLKIHEPQCLKKWKLANPRYYSRKGSSGGMFKANSVNALHSASTSKPLKQSDSKKTLASWRTPVKSASCENLLNTSKEEGGSLQALRELSKSHGRLTPPRKPQMVPCYICGREFIKHSLQVHEKQCLKKWDAVKKSKKESVEKEKKKLAKTKNAPSKRHSINFPVTIKIDKADDLENNNLENDNPNSDGGSVEKPKTTVNVENTPKPRKPSTVTCYICGRAYGTASVSIHEKQCQKKWEAQVARQEEEDKLAKKMKRKPRPRSFVL